MKYKTNLTISVGLIILSFIAGIYFYSQMPDLMATHWGFDSEVNGYMSKFWGLFLVPIITGALFLLFMFLPKLDPLKGIYKFQQAYDWFIFAIVLFLLYVHGLIIIWNLGFKFNLGQLIMPAMSFLFFCIGLLMERTKRNWFVGIRTPWTLSSDKVWNKTHKVGGTLFKIAAVISLIGLLFPNFSLIFVVPIILVSIYLVVYSYWAYKK